MVKISGSTFYFKILFPTFWFGFLGFFMLVPILSGGLIESFFHSVIMPLVMATFGFFIFKNLVWDLVDEVYDSGDSLLFRKGSKEQIVKLCEIINISDSQFTFPERITISLRNEGPLGKDLVFRPPLRYFTFTKNKLVRELIERVDKAKNT